MAETKSKVTRHTTGSFANSIARKRNAIDETIAIMKEVKAKHPEISIWV